MRQAKMIAGAAVLLLAAYTYAADMPAGVQAKTNSGKTVLADASGMTLYTYGRDSDNKSNCSGNCAKNWPPLKAAADAQEMPDWTVVTRDDGSKQWAYKAKPLYTYVKDAKPGNMTGDGAGPWLAATP